MDIIEFIKDKDIKSIRVVTLVISIIITLSIICKIKSYKRKELLSMVDIISKLRRTLNQKLNPLTKSNIKLKLLSNHTITQPRMNLEKKLTTKKENLKDHRRSKSLLVSTKRSSSNQLNTLVRYMAKLLISNKLIQLQ